MAYKLMRLQHHVKEYDTKLFVRELENGMTAIYREAKNPAVEPPHFILPLTEDWSTRTKAVEWGIEPLLARLREIDGHAREDIIRVLEEQYDKKQRQKKKEIRNQAEAFFTDHRSEFKKAFADVNTSNMDMKKRKD